jgi:hypothetical protein
VCQREDARPHLTLETAFRGPFVRTLTKPSRACNAIYQTQGRPGRRIRPNGLLCDSRGKAPGGCIVSHFFGEHRQHRTLTESGVIVEDLRRPARVHLIAREGRIIGERLLRADAKRVIWPPRTIVRCAWDTKQRIRQVEPISSRRSHLREFQRKIILAELPRRKLLCFELQAPR